MDFSELNERISPSDESAMTEAKRRWDNVAKPLGSLGLLEDAIIRIAGINGNADVCLSKRAVLVLCADNGVVREGVTQTGQEITGLVAASIRQGGSSVCRMAAAANADVFPVDMGMVEPVPGVSGPRIAAGTQNIAEGPAMTREQAVCALKAGMALAREYKEKGYHVLLTGEMGIGNTSTSSALCAALLHLPVEEVTGRGAGLSDAGLVRKISVLKRALATNASELKDPLGALSSLGGFDIAGMAGIFLGGALYRMPVMIDGFISAISALVAAKLCPRAVCAMLPSHVSAEPAGRAVLAALSLKPLICAEMRLGEGTGAVTALPLLDMALAVYTSSASFAHIGMEGYTPQGGESQCVFF